MKRRAITEHEYRIIRHLWLDALEHEATVTLGHYRYFIRLADGTAALDEAGRVIESHDAGFIAGAILWAGGTIQDRYNWKYNHKTLQGV